MIASSPTPFYLPKLPVAARPGQNRLRMGLEANLGNIFMVAVMNKACLKCGGIGPFATDRQKSSGLSPYCKKCKAEEAHKYYQEHRDRICRQWKEQWAENVNGKKDKAKNYREENRHKVRKWKLESQKRNRASANKRQRKYELVNKGRLQQQGAERYRTDPILREKIKIQGEKWRAKNPGKVVANVHRRRARLVGVGGIFTEQEWLSLKEFYGCRCLCCGKKEPEVQLTRDHVVPLEHKGKNVIENIQPLCMSCNCSKGTKIIDYRKAPFVRPQLDLFEGHVVTGQPGGEA